MFLFVMVERGKIKTMLTKEKVYEIIKKVPKGKVITYKQIANALNSKAYRHVGKLVSQNKKDDVPCHRVVNQNSFIGHFSKNGDIKTKKQLLKKEGIEIENYKIKNFQNYYFEI